MSGVDAVHLDLQTRAREVLLRLVADGLVLIGTPRTLADGLGIPVSDLRSGLRVLVEAERIAIHTQPSGQLTIRQTCRPRALSALPLPVHHRRPPLAVWTV